MENYINFGICLTELLNITNTRNIQLANAINVDPSLISKWKTGKRKVSPNSNYLKTISNYLSSSITNEYQKNSIMKIADKFNICIKLEYFDDINKYIYTLLQLSLQVSKPNLQNNMINDANNVIIANSNETQINNQYNFGSIHNFQLIKGEENIINASIALLKSIPVKPHYINESILITFFTELNSYTYLKQAYSQWFDILLEVQKKGWSINKLISINNNKDRNIRIIHELLKNISSERYTPYFWNKYNILFHHKEMIFIPTIGVIICFLDIKSGKLENAFFLKDKPSLEVFEHTFFLTYSHLTPLVTDKANITNTSLLTNFTAYEKLNGNRFAYNCCFDLLSVPVELYCKILLLYNKTIKSKEMSLIIEERNSIEETFNKQIKNYKSIDIYSKEFIENLVKTSKEPNAILNSYDIYLILDNIICMLENYENYNIALINNSKDNIFYNFSWVIKESNTVLINNFHQNIKNDEKFCISITEPTIVHYVTNCFKETLNKIAPINKEKKTVISWFKSQMQYLTS